MHTTEHADGRLDDLERWTVPLSLWASFLANDGEELMTMPRTTGLPPAHVRVGVGVMGMLLSAAVVDGIRTRGCGRLYQDVQLVFGAHGLGHIATALLAKAVS